jgi:hypothetical protein
VFVDLFFFSINHTVHITMETQSELATGCETKSFLIDVHQMTVSPEILDPGIIPFLLAKVRGSLGG